MSRKSKKAARAKARASQSPTSPTMDSLKLKAENGNLTSRDIDMLYRMRREQLGLNGHTGEVRSGSDSSSNQNDDYQWQGRSSGSSQNRSKGMDYSKGWEDYHKGSRGGYQFQSQSSGYQPKEDGIFCVESSEITAE